MFQDSEIGAMTAGGAFGYPPHSKYEKLISLAKKYRRRPQSLFTLATRPRCAAPCEAAELGIIKPILVGPVAKITAVAKQHGIDIARYELVDAPHSEAAAAKAVELIHEGKGELLMKGSLHTDELMRAVTSGDNGPAHRAAHQSRLHHGRADPFGDAFHHRCGHQYLSRSRSQARHRAERDRPVHADRSGHAAGRASSRRSRR